MESVANLANYALLAQDASQAQESPQQSESPAQQPQSNKRKAGSGDDVVSSQQQQQRAKRNRYISIACNECKRRKIKCNGQTPCQRCGNLNLECVYAPNCCNGFKETQEYKELSQQVQGLREQVAVLFEALEGLRGVVGEARTDREQLLRQEGIDPALRLQGYEQFGSNGMGEVTSELARPKSRAQVQQPSFRGPTSSDFNFSVARSSLQTMGITGQSQGTDDDGAQGEGGNVSHQSPVRSPPPPRQESGSSQPFRKGKDPIWKVSKEEALRLCTLFEDEMGLMYPVVSVDRLQAYAVRLYGFMDAVTRNGFVQLGMPGADAIDDEDTNILKVVLAIAMTVEGSGRSEQGTKLFEYVQPEIDATLLGNVGVKGVQLLALTAMYNFNRDNEGTSWRIIGLTARLCIELGLHRRETYEMIKDDSERVETTLLFWAIYVLDRRWSLGTGMPFALQDADIDPLLPKPADHSPYLNCMIQYSALGSKVWRTVVSTPSPLSSGGTSADEMAYLDYQVVQWHRNVPVHLRFEHPSQSAQSLNPIGPSPSRAGRRLRILLYLRANQMRILIYRPVLHSATSIMQFRNQAHIVVDVAKDTIRVLTHINQTTDLYRTQQVLFNAFLTSALAVMFLAIAHTPAIFADAVREEFYMALELVRGFSKDSFVSKRLWKTIRVLKEVAPHVGLAVGKNSDDPQLLRQRLQQQRGQGQGQGQTSGDVDPSRSAAVAMAGLAGHDVTDEMALFQNGRHDNSLWSGAMGSSSSPEGIANDLTSLFEAAGGYQALGEDGSHRQQGLQQHGYAMQGQRQLGSGAQSDGGIAAMFGGEEGLSGILKELF